MKSNMNFAIFSKEKCPYCEKIAEVMKLAKLSHVIYKLDEHFTKDGFYGQFGEGSTFPQVVCNGDKLGGCKETIEYLKEKNILNL